MNPVESTTVFWMRNGTRTSRKAVRRNRLAMVEAKRVTGKIGEIMCSIQPTLADAFEKMTEEEWCDYSGSCTWKRVER